jgi:CHAT domain-containing protein
VIGLSRALISAGTPNVLVSLWKVPDRATSALMEAFYQQWRANPEAGKAAALRAAMRQVRDDYPDQPLSWAAFTLIGVAE